MYYKTNIFPLPEVISVYEIIRQTVWRCADEQNIIVLILDGSCSFAIANVSHSLSAGDMILIPAGQEYIRRPVNNTLCRMAYIHFKTADPIDHISKENYNNAINNLVKEYYDKRACITQIFLPQVTNIKKDFNEINERFQQLLSEYRSDNKIEYLSASLSFLRFLLLMQKNVMSQHLISTRTPDSPRSPIIQTAIEYIRKNYESKITLDDLQKLTNISAQHLIRLFRKELEMTPVEYINHVKILHANELLRSSSLTIEEISYKLGYESSSYFGKVFKKYTGRTPIEERKRIKTFNTPKK
jgi:YesN/AraC family two-component response regulator